VRFLNREKRVHVVHSRRVGVAVIDYSGIQGPADGLAESPAWKVLRKVLLESCAVKSGVRSNASTPHRFARRGPRDVDSP
jgi:hypothetical protein